MGKRAGISLDRGAGTKHVAVGGRVRRAFRAGLFLAAAVILVAGLVPSPASAFCGFYVSGADAKLFNDATQVVLMRDGTRTVMSIQNDYKGPPQDFALVVPVPVVLAKENVKTLSPDVFKRVDALSAPRLVEYWEQDPCPPPGGIGLGTIGTMGSGQGFGSGHGRLGGGSGEVQVKIEAQFAVGEYEIVILSAENSGALDTWLRDNKYKIPDNAEPALKPYVAAGSKFFVAKVNVAKVKFENGRASLSPLRFHYDSEKLELPVKLGLLNSGGTQDLIVNIIAPERYEVANYTNVTIPTNLDVNEATKSNFGSFYASLFDRTLEKHPNAVVTEYAWQATSCDPCPGAVQGMSGNDLASLGADVLPSVHVTASFPRSSGASSPSLRQAPVTVTGKLPPEVIQRIVRQNFGRYRLCYENGLRSNPNLQGRVAVKLDIDDQGAVTGPVADPSTDLPDPSVVACIVRGFGNLSFPQPEDKKKVSVVYPIIFSPGSAPIPPLPSARPGAPPPPPPVVNVSSTRGPLTLTRLHARYGKDTLGSDLVFRVADHIAGGREQLTGADNKLEHGAVKSPMSNFQARYAIRHKWPGKIACKEPVRGVWGGPWPGTPKTPPLTATKLAYQKRGNLASFTSATSDELDIMLVSSPAVAPPPAPAPAPASAADAAAPSPSDAGPASDGLLDGGGPTTPPVPPSSHCGCRVVGAAPNAGVIDRNVLATLTTLAAALGLAITRRRSRRSDA